MEACRTTLLNDYITLSRIIVYAQSIEASKIRRMARSFKRSGANDQEQQGLRRRFNLKENVRVLISWLRKAIVPRMASLLVQIVSRNIMVSVSRVPGVAFVLVRKVTK